MASQTTRYLILPGSCMAPIRSDFTSTFTPLMLTPATSVATVAVMLLSEAPISPVTIAEGAEALNSATEHEIAELASGHEAL